MITVEVMREGLNIELLGRIFDRVIERFIAELAERTEEVMREKAPERTGRLKKSIRKIVKPNKAVIGPIVPYAIYVEYGTRPHEILPVHARTLRFEVDGRIVFAARVWHPGTRPQPFVRETAEQIREEAAEVFRDVFVSEGW